ncbi:hypothetical protein Tco_0111881 [Tanacetum coccineum]
MVGEDKFHDDNPPPPPPVTPTQQAPHTVSTIKLPILKKGKYDIWAMKMEHYLGHTDYPIWEIIQKVNGPVQVSTDTNGQIKVLPPKTAEEILVRERERKARTTLLMAIPEDHLAKFHKMTDAKEIWEAIKSRFGGNDEAKKIQKYILKQQFESFSVSNSEGLHKGYDRFQSLLSQLEIHDAGVSTQDANQKFLRSLPASWSQVSLIIRTKPGVDTLSFNDLYNNHRVFESDIKGSTASSSSTHNVAFVSSKITNSTNDVDEFDLEEMDLKWQVAMISIRLKKFYNKTGRRLQFDAKEPVGFDKTKVKYKAKYNGRRPGKHEEPKSLVTLNGEGVDWTGHAEDEQENFALMAYSNSGSNTEVTSCSKECVESYAKLKKLYDEQREQLGDASIEIQAYTQALKKMSTRDKSGLGYRNQIHEGVLSYEKKFLKVYLIVETLESVPEPVVVEPKVVSQPKDWSDAPIIEEYESYSDDEYVIEPSKEQEKPSFAFVNTIKHVKTPRETVKEQNTCSPSPKVELNKQKGKGTGQGENRPVWNNVQRLNHQNKFVPKAVLTKTGIFSVNTARQNLFSQAAETSTVRKVNIARPIVNEIRLRNNFYKSHSPIRRPFNKSTAPKAKFTNNKVNTVGDKTVSAVRGYREIAGLKTITEASLRRHMKLEDNGGITSLPNIEIFEQLALMGYATDSDKLTFQKGNFSPQWRFFIHTILHCLSSKKTSWEQFSSNIATAIICLATNKTFNFSKFVFDAMVKNLDNPHKFLITPSTSPPPITETTPTAEEPAPMPYESPLQSVQSLRSDEGSVSLNELIDLVTQLTNKVGRLENELTNTKKVYGSAITKLVKRVKKLEKQVKTGKAMRRTKIVLSEDEAVKEDYSKQGRSLIEELDMDADISLVPLHDAEIQEKISDDTEVFLEEEETTELIEEPTELVEDQGSGEKGEQEVTIADTILNIASVPISTASATPEVSIATANLVYIRRSAEKRKDKGKAIMIEDEYVQKNSKKHLEQERLSHKEAIRLQEQIDAEERKRIARDAEIAKQLQEEYDKAGKKEAVTKVDTAHVIDWNDPSVIRYHALQNRPRSVAEVRKNMIMYLKNQGGYKDERFQRNEL